jgi:hypothetical protein
LRHAFTLAITALLISTAARAQLDASLDADSIDPVFRAVIDSLSAVAGYGSLRDATLPQQRSDLLGLDGVTLLVEYRDGRGYRAYYYWTPRAEAQDANERAAAKIMETILALYRSEQ